MLRICSSRFLIESLNDNLQYAYTLLALFTPALIGVNFDAVALNGPVLTVFLLRLHRKNLGFGGN